MIDARQYVFDNAVIALAGPVAEYRATHRIAADGWIPLLPPRERRIAVHEAGHCIATLAVGQFAHEASIVPDRFTGGRVVSSRSAERPERPELIEEKIESDRSQAARLALLLTECDACPRWKAILHMVKTIRRRAEEIIEENWLDVLTIAGALERYKRLDRSGIEGLVKSSPRVS